MPFICSLACSWGLLSWCARARPLVCRVCTAQIVRWLVAFSLSSPIWWWARLGCFSFTWWIVVICSLIHTCTGARGTSEFLHRWRWFDAILQLTLCKVQCYHMRIQRQIDLFFVIYHNSISIRCGGFSPRLQQNQQIEIAHSSIRCGSGSFTRLNVQICLIIQVHWSEKSQCLQIFRQIRFTEILKYWWKCGFWVSLLKCLSNYISCQILHTFFKFLIRCLLIVLWHDEKCF